MTLARKIQILLAVSLILGVVRMPLENSLSEDLREAGLKRERLDIGTKDTIQQTSGALALGGMRTLVANIFNMRAHLLFEERKWDELESTYDVIVDLAPQTRHYWETGAWHLSYNAASAYLHDSDMPTLRRRETWRSFVHRGRAFLERGILNNPDDWSLHASLAHMLRDPNKFLAFRDRDECLLTAAESYSKAIEHGAYTPLLLERFRLYCLVRVPGYEQDSLSLGRKLYADPRHRKPTLVMLLYVMECRADPDRDVEALAMELFGDARTAYDALTLHWQRTREGYPMDGVAEGLARLERSLGIPTPQSILAQPPPSAPTLEDWFKDDR